VTPRDEGVSIPDVDTPYVRIFRDHYPGVVRTVHLIVRDRYRAEDVAQEAFLRLLRDWSKVSGYERPEAWVRRVAIRLAMRGVRRERLWARLRSLLAPPAATPEPRDPDLPAAIARLTPPQRAAIVLFYYEDRSTREIAYVLGCTESTVRVHLHHARRRLATLVGEGDPDALR
jgi:RNA polymerase sigma-70 factor (ECF subfamily)